MLRISKITASFALVAIVVTGCAQPGAQPKQTPSSSANGAAPQQKDEAGGDILIGLVAALTGEAANSGQLEKDGAELAVDDINAKGGVLGKKLKLVPEDDAANPTADRNVVNKLLFETKVFAMVGPIRSTFLLGAEGMFKQAGTPMVTGGSLVKLTHMGNPWIHRLRPDDDTVAKLAAQFAIKDRKHTKVAIIHDSDEFGTAGAEAVAAAAKTLGAEVVVRKSFDTGAKDFSGQLLAAKNAGADVIIGWGTRSEDCGLLLLQRQQLGVNIELVGSASFGAAASVKVAGKASEGIYLVTDYVPEHPDADAQAWAKRFQDKYKQAPDFFAVTDYNAVLAIADAIRRAGALDKQKVADEMKKTDGLQAVGLKLYSNAVGDLNHRALIVKVGAEGKRSVESVVDKPLEQIKAEK